MRRLKIYSAALISFLSYSFFGCVASSSYYSARTLEENKLALSFSADDIIIKDSKSSSTQIGISKNLPFAPSLGLAYGLPFRLETALRWYPPEFVEFTLRDQINPATFDIFDGSIDVSYASLINAYSYIKYGATISKSVNNYEPFVHYYFYHTVGTMTGSNSGSLDGFITDLTSDIINNSRIVGFGVGVPVSKLKFYPEIDYQYFGNDLSSGLWHVGIGLRIFTN